MAFVARCPDCGKRARLPDQQAGTGTVCAACGFQFKLPESPETAGSSLEAPKPRNALEEAGEGPRGSFKSRAILAVGAILLLGIGAHGFGFDILRQFRLAYDRAIAVNLNADAQVLASSRRISRPMHACDIWNWPTFRPCGPAMIRN